MKVETGLAARSAGPALPALKRQGINGEVK